MEVEIVRWAQSRPQPWKNGGGVTFELAVSPKGADLSEFDWRISVAEVEVDGPFSLFEGIDRTLVLIEGDGIELDIEGRFTTLTKLNPRLTFSGSVATNARLVDGPIRDLNIMTRTSRIAHRIAAQGSGKLVPFSEFWMLFALESSEVHLSDRQIQMSAFDLLLVRGEPASAATNGQFWLIELSAA